MIDNTKPRTRSGVFFCLRDCSGGFFYSRNRYRRSGAKARMRFKPSMRPYNANFTRGNDITLPTRESLLYALTGG